MENGNAPRWAKNNAADSAKPIQRRIYVRLPFYSIRKIAGGEVFRGKLSRSSKTDLASGQRWRKFAPENCTAARFQWIPFVVFLARSLTNRCWLSTFRLLGPSYQRVVDSPVEKLIMRDVCIVFVVCAERCYFLDNFRYVFF